MGSGGAGGTGSGGSGGSGGGGGEDAFELEVEPGRWGVAAYDGDVLFQSVEWE